MMEFLRFTFQSPLHFLGVFILIFMVLAFIHDMIIAARR